MADRDIINPAGALSMSVAVSDHRTGRDANGNPLAYKQEVVTFQSSGAISVGDLVSLVPPSAADTPLRVKQAVTGDIAAVKIGVALTASTATGQNVQVVTNGFCHVNVGSGTPAAGGFGTPSSTAGQVTYTAAASPPDATTVVGTLLGVFLGAKDSNNRAPFWLQKL